MRLAEIDENGIVANVIEVDLSAVPAWAAGFVDIGDVGGPGWHWDGQAFSPPPDPGPDRSAMSLSFAQLMIGLKEEGWIDEAQGDAWQIGILPAPVLALIATMPANLQYRARTKARRPSVVLRADPLVVLLGQAQGKTDAELDAFFLTYATF